VGGQQVQITEEAVARLPFGTLLHFSKDPAAAMPTQPPVLLVAPLSGHFATLLRETVRTMLPITTFTSPDWLNARDVSVSHGDFGLDDHIGYLMRFIATVGPGCHVIAVCQPCVAALAAVALMPKTTTGPAAQPHADGRSRRLPREPDRSQPAGGQQADRLVRAEPDQPCATASCGLPARVYPGSAADGFMSMNLSRTSSRCVRFTSTWRKADGRGATHPALLR